MVESGNGKVRVALGITDWLGEAQAGRPGGLGEATLPALEFSAPHDWHSGTGVSAGAVLCPVPCLQQPWLLPTRCQRQPPHVATTKNVFRPFKCVCLVTQSCPTLCDPMDCSPPGSSVDGTLQARILELVVMPSSRGSSPPKDQACISCVSSIVGGFFTSEPLGKPLQMFPGDQNTLWLKTTDLGWW